MDQADMFCGGAARLGVRGQRTWRYHIEPRRAREPIWFPLSGPGLAYMLVRVVHFWDPAGKTGNALRLTKTVLCLPDGRELQRNRYGGPSELSPDHRYSRGCKPLYKKDRHNWLADMPETAAGLLGA